MVTEACRMRIPVKPFMVLLRLLVIARVRTISSTRE